MRDARHLAFPGLLLVWALACGGGGGSGSAEGAAGTSAGALSGFGSFFVTGTEWSLAPEGTVEIDGATGDLGGAFDESDLLLGMYLEVEGVRQSGGTGTADTVIYDEAILGPIEMAPVLSSDDQQKSFNILGQTVIVDLRLTVFEGRSFDTLAMGDVLEVSGPFALDADDDPLPVVATRVELVGGTDVEFKGQVEGGGAVAGSFTIDGITVGYDCNIGMDDCSGLSSSFPEDENLVEVEGELTGPSTVDADVLRSFVPFAPDPAQANMVLEGRIDDFAGGLAAFRVNGTPVNATGAVLDPAGHAFAAGDLVRVTGDLDAGVLVASRLELGAGMALVAAEIPSGGLDARDMGELRMGIEGSGEGLEQVVVDVTSSTRFEDHSAAADPDLDFAELMVGEYLEVRGVVTGTGRMRATSIVRTDGGDVFLRGDVEEIDTDADGGIGFTALGLFVELEDATAGVSGDALGFLGGLAIGDLVEARDADETDRFGIADEVETF